MIRNPLHRLSAALLLLGVFGCSTPDPSQSTVPEVPKAEVERDTSAGEQISHYIRCVFQDRDGNLWFGTTNDGAVRYDGRSLEYFTVANDFGSDWVNAIVQDAHGALWFATRDGLVRHDGRRFKRFTTKDGLVNDHLWSLLLDKSGVLWCGTWEGACRFDGSHFTPIPIPAADLSRHPYYEDPKKINAIVQDHAGNIWFASNGGGAYRYDPSTPLNGSSLTSVSEKDGLCSDFTMSMLVDRSGTIWFGTAFHGLCTYDPVAASKPGGNAFARVDLPGENQGILYQQPDGTIWTVKTYTGLCRRDGTQFTCFTEADGTGIRVPMNMVEDRRGRLWIGTGAGLYRYADGKFNNVTKDDLMRISDL